VYDFLFFGLIFTQNQLETHEVALLAASLTELATELAVYETSSQSDLLLEEEELELFFSLLLASSEDELLDAANFFSSSSKSFLRALFYLTTLSRLP